MKTITQHIRESLTQNCGINRFDLDQLKSSEWSDEFERLQRNRLIMGAFRYGRLGESGKPQFDRVKCALKHLCLYGQTGNLEHLIDVGNLAMVEFEEGLHPDRHFRSADDGFHAKELST